MDDNLKFIKKFGKISISRICRELKIDYRNLYNNRTKKSNILKVKKHIESEYAKLYIIKDEENE